MPKIIRAYVRDDCPYCVALRQTASELHISISYIDHTDPSYQSDRLKFNHHTLPLVIADDELVGGYVQFANNLHKFLI